MSMTELIYDGQPVPVLQDWTRWAWASMVERDWWAPQFTAASVAYQQVERLSVADRVRPSAYQFVNPEDLLTNIEWARDRGLLCVPITTATRITGSYNGASAVTPVPGQPFSYRVLFLTPETYATMPDGPLTNAQLGALLGYPVCCRAAFDDTWGRGQVDSTWEQLQSAPAVGGPASTLMRWMGLRLVSHMPCSYNCEESKIIAQQMFDVGCKHGYREEMTLIKSVLNWPVKWSRMFGIAELVTPAIKISTRSDWTPTKESARMNGTYIKPVKEWWTENGFATAGAMRDTHLDVISALVSDLPHGARVLDLGCGNGHLVKRLAGLRPDLTIGGVDTNELAIRRAKVQPLPGETYWNDTIQSGCWKDWGATAILMNPGRLTEMTVDEAADVWDWICKAPTFYPYLYGDWQANTSLGDLCRIQLGVAVSPMIKTPRVELGKILSY